MPLLGDGLVETIVVVAVAIVIVGFVLTWVHRKTMRSRKV